MEKRKIYNYVLHTYEPKRLYKCEHIYYLKDGYYYATKSDMENNDGAFSIEDVDHFVSLVNDSSIALSSTKELTKEELLNKLEEYIEGKIKNYTIKMNEYKEQFKSTINKGKVI